MRRKCVTIAVVLALLAAICTAEQAAVRLITQRTLAMTRDVNELIAAGDMESAIKKTRALDKAWDEEARRLEVLVDHGSTDDVRYALSRLVAALEGGDAAAARIYAGELEGSVEHVYERQAVTVENLF